MSASVLLNLGSKLQDKGDRIADKDFSEPVGRIEKVCEEIGKSWGGSWLGYQSRVYYQDFAPPPAGARFSQEWGFEDWPIQETTGDWREYTYDEVIKAIRKKVGHNVTLEAQEEEANEVSEFFDDAKATILSATSVALVDRPDRFLQELRDQIDKLRLYREGDFLKAWMPKKGFSRDMSALEQGFQAPPHIQLLAKTKAIRQPFAACSELGKLVRRFASHLLNLEKRQRREARIGTNIFIGHGHSPAWRDLKDFIQDRLNLPWDEFNRVPSAGVTNIARLSQMLDEAAIALLVMTGEDEQTDGKLYARMNVIHEAGLFQGRLGFERAIVLLEEGCDEFSNIQGLGQLRFPKGNIRAIFEEIRIILEREGLLVEVEGSPG